MLASSALSKQPSYLSQSMSLEVQNKYDKQSNKLQPVNYRIQLPDDFGLLPVPGSGAPASR